MRGAIICMAANDAYFSMLAGLVASLEAAPLAGRLARGVLDLGLTGEQRAWLTDHGCRLVVPGWDTDFPHRDKAPAHYRAMTARPFLPTHFPGFETIVWIDADAWVQDDWFLPHMLAAAEKGKLAVVPELDRGYWTSFKPPKLWGQNQKVFAWGYGLRAGYRLGRNPILNSGVFALSADAPHWPRWAAAHARALNRRRHGGSFVTHFNFFLAEQTALNYVVFAEKLPYTLLPATANWFCGKGTPKWDSARGVLVEPHAPYQALGVVHLAGKGMKERVWDLETLEGGRATLRLTYEEVVALRARERGAAVS